MAEKSSSILFFFGVIIGDLSTITALIRCHFVCNELHLPNSLELPVKLVKIKFDAAGEINQYDESIGRQLSMWYIDIQSPS